MTEPPETPFDPGSLHRLVDSALAAALRPTHPDAAASEPGPGRRSQVMFGLGGYPILEHLVEILARYLPMADTQNVLDELRSALYHSMVRPQLVDLHTRIRSCRRCPDMDGDPALPQGNVHEPDLVLVHELPPRAGIHHDRWDEYLQRAGFNAARVMHTSVVRCDPAMLRPVTDQESQTCTSTFLFTELMMAQPKLIVTAGARATDALLGDSLTLTAARGMVHWRGPWPILPTWTVAYVTRRPDAREALDSDLRAAHRFLYGTAAP